MRYRTDAFEEDGKRNKEGYGMGLGSIIDWGGNWTKSLSKTKKLDRYAEITLSNNAFIFSI